VRLRVALAALAAFLLAPNTPPFSLEGQSMFSIVGIMGKEVCIGLLLGFVGRLVFIAVDLAGNIVATEIGLNLGTILNPLSQGPSQIPASILYFLAAMVMLGLDLHHWMLLGFERTYSVLPMGAAHLNGDLFNDILNRVSKVFVISLQIAAPVIAVSFVVTVIFGVLSRAVPQMNVFQLSFAFRIAAGLAVFAFTLQLAAQHVSNYLNRLPNDLVHIAQLIGVKS
jgi:flagellar biosynthesis protein FliR